MKPDIVKLKKELYEKLRDIDIKVLTLMKHSVTGCNYFRSPTYLVCIRLMENLDGLKMKEVETGIELADEFLKELNLSVENLVHKGEEDGSN